MSLAEQDKMKLDQKQASKQQTETPSTDTKASEPSELDDAALITADTGESEGFSGSVMDPMSADTPSKAAKVGKAVEPVKKDASVTEGIKFGEAELNQDAVKKTVSDELLSQDKDTLVRLLTEPEEIVSDLANKVLEKIDARSEHKSKVQKAWDTFFNQNVDLKSHDDLVQLVSRDLENEFRYQKKSVSWEEGSAEVAKRVRKLLGKGIPQETEEVKGSGVTVVSSSAYAAPQGVTKPVARKSTADVLRDMQKARKALR